MKKIQIFSFFLIMVLFLTACGKMKTQEDIVKETAMEQTDNLPPESSEASNHFLDMLDIALPNGIEKHRVSDQQDDFMKGQKKVGGVILEDCGEEVFADARNYLTNVEPLVMDAMASAGVTCMEWQMGGGSTECLYEFKMGNGQTEYIAYFFRGMGSSYVVWFDKNVVSDESIQSIIQSVRSEDIREELNKVATEDIMAAINQEMEGRKFDLVLDWPEGVTQENTSLDGALFYQNGTVIGGYQTVHFEEGILPAVQENQELILNRLKESTKHQLDLTDYTAQITSESPITVTFGKGEKEYIHYLHYFGQIGTQYDVWFDASAVDEITRLTIFATAKLKEIID